MRAHEFITENSWREAYKSPYQVFGLPDNADMSLVTSAYKRMISKWHPDKWSNANTREKKIASIMSQYVNTARSDIEKGWGRNIFSKNDWVSNINDFFNKQKNVSSPLDPYIYPKFTKQTPAEKSIERMKARRQRELFQKAVKDAKLRAKQKYKDL